ncbi:MAG: hypothetical protein CNF02_02305 [OM182 bacterium MED-G28]|uniref:HTH tetR-type domain-containing protein n=1 Tax=OM182 bacterium MED-G28 TaxID=1986256 RepID=A0A2A5WFI4_9GAMM|nr:MAG: hypothetical protein CNF02_02305 [OM182 bacterium MED-G28]
MQPDENKPQQHYHHGNVKESLIDVAVKLIDSNEVELLSLRSLAKEVGITPSAVYNHFPNKDALMLEIKIRLYDEFNKFFESRCNRTNDPEQDLLEVCIVYYYFSQDYPSRFQFLFSYIFPMEWSNPELVELSCRTLVRTRKLILEIYDKYNVPVSDEKVVNTSLLVWAQLHGLVALKKSGSIKAAVAFQGWPEACSLVNHEQAEGLIRNHLRMTVNAILNTLQGEGHR